MGGARPGAGRPSSFTPKLGDDICRRIEAGKRPAVAAAECGIPPSTFDTWMARARNGEDKELAEFRDNVSRARLVGEGKLHDTVLTGDEKGAGFGPAKAALEVLSRTNKHYAPKVQVGLERELNRVLDVIERICSPEDRDRIFAELALIAGQSAAGEDPDSEDR